MQNRHHSITGNSPLTALLCIYTLAFFYNGRPEEYGIYALLISGMGLLLFYTFLWPGEQRRRFQGAESRVELLILLFASWLFINPWIASAPAKSWELIWVLMGTPWAFLIIRQFDLSKAALCIVLLPVAGLPFAIYGIYEIISGLNQASGSFIDANLFGAQMNLFLVPIICYYLFGGPLLKKAHRYNWLALCLIVIFFMAVLASGSRGTTWSLLIILISVFGIGLYRKLPKKRFGIILMILTCTYLVNIGIQQITGNSVGAQRITNVNLKNDNSFSTRLLMYRSMITMYKENPLLGSGINSYDHLYPAYRDPRDNHTSGDLGHNDYLQYLIEGGPIHLIFLLSIAVFIPLLICIRILRTGLLHDIGIPLAILAVSIHALVNFNYYSPVILLTLGLYLGYCDRTQTTQSNPHPGKPHRMTPAWYAAFFIIGVLFPGIATLDATATYALIKASDDSSIFNKISTSNEEGFFDGMMLISALRPGNYYLKNFSAKAYEDLARRMSHDANRKRQLLNMAASDYADILKVLPHSDKTLVNLAMLKINNPDIHFDTPKDPVALLQQAIRSNPTNAVARIILSDIYVQANEGDAAINTLKDMYPWLTNHHIRQDGLTVMKHGLETANYYKNDSAMRFFSGAIEQYTVPK